MKYGDVVKLSEEAIASLLLAQELDRLQVKQAKRRTEVAKLNREIQEGEERVRGLETAIRRLREIH